MTANALTAHEAAEQQARAEAAAFCERWQDRKSLLALKEIWQAAYRKQGPTHQAMAMCEEIHRRLTELDEG